MGAVKKAVVAALIIVFAMLGAGSAAAQDTGKPPTDWDKQHAECMDQDRTREGSPARALADALPDGVSDEIKSFACGDDVFAKDPGALAEEVASHLWDGKLAGIVREIKDGNPAVIAFTMSLWTKFKLDPDALAMSANGINNIAWKVALGGLALMIVVGLIRTAAARSHGSGQALEGAAKGYGQYLLYGALVPTLAVPAIMALDAFADNIINTYVANGGDFSKIGDAATIGEDMNPILVLVFVLISLMGSLMMCLTLIMRIILLPVIIGLMPVFAAWAVGRQGKFTVENAMGLLVSFALLKVIAALVYAAAVWAALGLDGSPENKLVSMVIFGATGLCGPALVSMVMPMMRGQAGGSPVGATGAALGATGAIAGGAITAGSMAAGAGTAAAGAVASGMSSAASGAGSLLGSSGAPSGGGGSRGAGGAGSSGDGGGPSTGGGGGSGGPTPSTGGGGGSRMGGAHRAAGAGSGRFGGGAGPSTGGGGSFSQTAARVARNGGAMAGSAVRGAGGMLNDSIGAPVHPSRAHM